MTDKQRRLILFTTLAGVAAWALWLALNEPAEDVELVEVAKTSSRAKPAPAKPAATPAARKPSEAPYRLMLARTNLRRTQLDKDLSNVHEVHPCCQGGASSVSVRQFSPLYHSDGLICRTLERLGQKREEKTEMATHRLRVEGASEERLFTPPNDAAIALSTRHSLL